MEPSANTTPPKQWADVWKTEDVRGNWQPSDVKRTRAKRFTPASETSRVTPRPPRHGVRAARLARRTEARTTPDAAMRTCACRGCRFRGHLSGEVVLQVCPSWLGRCCSPSCWSSNGWCLVFEISAKRMTCPLREWCAELVRRVCS